MAKRFTDTGKWKRQWFRALSPHAKVLWQYLCDECDHAGIFLADFALTTFQVGFKVDEEKLRDLLGDKVVKIDGDKYFIPSFFEFQYADAKDGFKAKQSALKKLRSLKLVDSSDALVDLTNSYLRVPGQSPDCHIIGIGKSKSKSNTGGVGDFSDALSAADYEAVYQKYPKKVGKSDGLEKLKRVCRTPESLVRFELAMMAYIEKCRANDTYFKQFDTFVNSKWEDCLEPGYGDAGAASDMPDLSHIDWEPDGVA